MIARRAICRSVSARASRRSTKPPLPLSRSSTGERDVGGDRMLGDYALAQAVLRDQRHAGVDRVARPGDGRLALPAMRISPSTIRLDAADDARQRRAAGPEQAGEADDLAAMHRRGRHSRGLCSPRDVAQLEQRRRRSRRPRALTSDSPRERLPTMCSIIVSIGSSESGAVITCRPSRRMVARSAMRAISSIRCET